MPLCVCDALEPGVTIHAQRRARRHTHPGQAEAPDVGCPRRQVPVRALAGHQHDAPWKPVLAHALHYSTAGATRTRPRVEIWRPLLDRLSVLGVVARPYVWGMEARRTIVGFGGGGLSVGGG